MNFDIESFASAMQQKKQYIESCLDAMLTKEGCFPPLIHQAMRYAVFNGGKRLRPIMVMEGAKIAGTEGEAVTMIAGAIEMIHSYSLVHDDLPAMDDDDLRRGKPTCHKVYGEANAILAGDALLTGAFQLIARVAGLPGVDTMRLLRVIEDIAAAAGSEGMIGGQIMDLNSEYQNEGFHLERLHLLKTGALFKASLRAGAIIGGMDESGISSLTEYAHHFGLAFQITDDILDVSGDQSMLGKPVGSDEKNLKETYTTRFGLEGARELARQEAEACLQSMERFGSEANFLRQLAEFSVYRTN